jgi:hypothetical protein
MPERTADHADPAACTGIAVGVMDDLDAARGEVQESDR